MIEKINNLPLYFHKRGIYYGWVVLLVGTIGVIMSIPGQTMGISVFTDHLIKALGLSRKELSLAYLIGTMGSSFILPYAGRILDRRGSRFLGLMACTGMVVFLVWISKSPKLAGEISYWTGLNQKPVAFVVILLGFLGLRHFGQGQMTMSSRTMMGLWFDKKRGLMLGISGVFVAFGFGSAPLFLNMLITHFDWRHALYLLAAMCSGMGFLVYLTFRRAPEFYGLKVDGGSLNDNKNAEGKMATEPVIPDKDFTVLEAKKTYTYWVFNLAFVAQATLLTAVTFHMGQIGHLNSMSAAEAFGVFLYVAFLATVSDLAGGFLSDRIPMKYLLSFMQFMLCLALLGISAFGTELGYRAVIIGMGFSNGLFAQLSAAAWPKLFGRTYLGSISGASMAWIVMGSALGPFVFSLGLDTAAHFSTVVYLVALFPFSLGVASFFADKPVKA